jgi:hypothetical protein
MKTCRFSLVLMLILTGLSTIPAPHTAQAQALSPGCTQLNDPIHDHASFDVFIWAPMQFYANEIIVTIATLPPEADPTNVWFELSSVTVASGSIPPSPAVLTYQFPSDTTVTPAWYSDNANNIVDVTWDFNCMLPEEERPVPAAPEAGCDMQMDIPAGSVVGQFTQTITARWAPGQLTTPPVVIDGGKTAWVLGQDASGEFYKFLWACQYLWVPVGSMGPNYDKLWNGAPLPTKVVE